MVGTGKLFRVLWCKFHDIWFLVHLTINIFILDFERLQAFFSETTGKRNHLVHFSCCQFVIKYRMRDMMNYHCLKVFGTRIRRIGKHSPVFSVFRTRVPGSSDTELRRVPIQSTIVKIVPFDNNLSHARRVTYEV